VEAIKMDTNKFISESEAILLEDKNVITSLMARKYTSQGIASLRSSFLTNTKFIKNELIKNKVDVGDLQQKAKNLAYEIKPYVQKLLKDPKDYKTILSTLIMKVQSAAKENVDDNPNIDKGLRLYALTLFAEMALLVSFRLIFRGTVLPLLLTAFLFAPILEGIIIKTQEKRENKEPGAVYKKLLNAFKSYRVCILILVSGVFSIPFSLVLVALFTLRDVYVKVLDNEEFDEILKDKKQVKKITIVLFFTCLLVIFMRISVSQLMKLIRPLFVSWSLVITP
jgi:hypothetical protein